MKKPPTDKQLAANRANAARSTGPRTPAGKARAAQNSRTHGLAAPFGILRVEDREEMIRLNADALDYYQPVTAEEVHAVERVAICKLALVRAARLEAGMFTVALNMALNDDNVTPFVPLSPEILRDQRNVIEQTRNYALADGFNRMSRNSTAWTLFLRYYSQAERHYRRAVEDLARLQRNRPNLPNEPILDPQPQQTEPPPPPAVEPILTPPAASEAVAAAAPSAVPPPSREAAAPPPSAPRFLRCRRPKMLRLYRHNGTVRVRSASA